MNLWKSIIEYKENNYYNTTEDEQKERADICDKCEFSGILCKKCKCFLRVKICIASEKCPIDKWDRVDGKPTFMSNKKGCKGCNNKK